MRKIDSNLASVLVRQLLDNTMLSAGLVSDPKSFLTRVNKLMAYILNQSIGTPTKFENTENFKNEAKREEVSEAEVDSVLKQLKDEVDKKEGKKDESLQAEIVIDKDGNPQVKKN